MFLDSSPQHEPLQPESQSPTKQARYLAQKISNQTTEVVVAPAPPPTLSELMQGPSDIPSGRFLRQRVAPVLAALREVEWDEDVRLSSPLSFGSLFVTS